MTAGNLSRLDYNTDGDKITSILRDLGIEVRADECHVLQGGQETDPEASPVVEQHDKDCCSETVNTELSSTDSFKAPTASTAPNAEIQDESQGGTTPASSGTITWSRQDNGLVVCNLCSYSTKKVSLQIEHSRTHTGERPFSCDKCPQSFKRRSHLKRHRQTHTGLRPYVCNICPAAFMTAGYLNRHMGIHSQLPLKCVECNHQFGDTSSFTRHLARHLKWGHAWGSKMVRAADDSWCFVIAPGRKLPCTSATLAMPDLNEAL